MSESSWNKNAAEVTEASEITKKEVEEKRLGALNLYLYSEVEQKSYIT